MLKSQIKNLESKFAVYILEKTKQDFTLQLHIYTISLCHLMYNR